MKAERNLKKIAVSIELEWPVNRHYQVYAGIQAYAATKPGWELIPDVVPEVVLAGTWPTQTYDGLIGRIRPWGLKAARRAGIPIVNTWINSPAADKVSSVLPDVAESARMAVEHFAARGLRHLAHIGMHSDRVRMIQADTMRKETSPLSISFSEHVCSDARHSGLEAWQRFCEQIEAWAQEWQATDRLPIGVFGAEDLLGSQIAAVLPRSGWVIPDQIAIVTCGNSLVLCTSSTPAISSIDPDYFQNGFLAAQLLDGLMMGQDAPDAPILVPPKELHVRRSSDVYAVSDPQVAEALQFIADNCDKHLSVDLIAKQVKMGRRTLERRFKAVVGESITSKLNSMRVDRVKRLLLDTETPVKSIFADAGFGSEKQMRVMFSKYVGMTPNAFREFRRK